MKIESNLISKTASRFCSLLTMQICKYKGMYEYLDSKWFLLWYVGIEGDKISLCLQYVLESVNFNHRLCQVSLLDNIVKFSTKISKLDDPVLQMLIIYILQIMFNNFRAKCTNWNQQTNQPTNWKISFLELWVAFSTIRGILS